MSLISSGGKGDVVNFLRGGQAGDLFWNNPLICMQEICILFNLIYI